jgi:uncharacterized membrane protein
MVVGGLSDAAASILPLACDLLAGGLAGAGAVPIGVGCIASVPAGGDCGWWDIFACRRDLFPASEGATVDLTAGRSGSLGAIMLPLQKHISKDGFRLRGTEMSRIDGFSDVVFGFAVTLLVVSLEVPKTFGELRGLLQGFVPFAISFLLLMVVWHGHYKYFRRFGTEDVGTIWLNGMLMFFVLFYTYPLKFLFSAVFSTQDMVPAANDVRELTVLYGAGFAAIYALLTALYANGWRQRKELALDPLELRLTKLYMWDEGSLALIGVLSCAVAFALPAERATLATLLFMLIGVTKTWFGRKIGREHR